MARTFKSAQKQAGNPRIPLGEFSEPITILRSESRPSLTDASWFRLAEKMGDFYAAYESGEIKLIADDKQSDKELFLFVIHYDEQYQFTLQDYVIYGREVYHVQGYRVLTLGRNRYFQINTRSFGILDSGDFIISEDANVPDTLQPPNRDNPFWSNLPPLPPTP